MMGFLLILFYAMSAIVVCLPVIWWSRSLKWRWWELILPIVPFVLWFGLILVNGKGKTLSNGVIEPLLLGCAAGLPILFRAGANRSGRQGETAYFLGLAISCTIALVIYFWMPALPE